MVVLVCGGRNYWDQQAVFGVLSGLHHDQPISLLIHGGAKGADSLAGVWAYRNGVPCREFAADWEKYGKSAGPIRNRQMLDEGKPELVVAFPGGAGTRHMIEAAARRGLPIVYG